MKSLYRIGLIVLINIYLVIIAGSVVRMTGSGMGCPDWPKCFGYLIPPTNEAQITWKPNTSFNKKQMVVKEVKTLEGAYEKQLLVARKEFKSSLHFNLSNWEKYEKHDYATFNVFHTWTEYINRLFGALLGLFALIMLGLSIKHWKVNKWFTIISLAQLFFIGFEAWLGKLTVDANLAPVTITYHMLGVVVLIFVQLIFLRLVKMANKSTEKKPVKWFYIIHASILLLIAQIVLGTQVRQEVDHLLESGINRELIADQFSNMFYIHRSFSILLVISIGFICLKTFQNGIKKLSILLALTVILEVCVGMFLYYLGMKAYGQPFHLLLSLVMYGLLIQVLLNHSKAKN